MTPDFSQPNPPPGPVLELDGVVLPLLPSYDAGLDHVSLALGPGELAMVLLEQGLWDHPLPDLAAGLTPVEQGTIRSFGHAWSELNADQQAQARGRMGRVFEGHGWLSNLDVDENVTLAQRHHTGRPEDDIRAEAEKLARMAGLEFLPATRPSSTEREKLRRAEWVRAALGHPWLVILERPGRDLANGWIRHFKPILDHLRGRGAAVLWMAGSDGEWSDDSLKPSLKLRAEGNKLLTAKE